MPILNDTCYPDMPPIQSNSEGIATSFLLALKPNGPNIPYIGKFFEDGSF